MTWPALLSARRFYGPATVPAEDDERLKRPWRSAFLKDFDRIAYSSAFRRLQEKTQVHPFPQSDYVRTRLTHSLEVSSVGRSLGLGVAHTLAGKSVTEIVSVVPHFGEIVAAACLAHDLGHPPFGHAGEEAISHFFNHDRPDLLKDLSASEASEFQSFNSNAQSFRLVTRLQFWREEGGMQLTLATLGAMTKYPSSAAASSKYGYFQTDKGSFGVVAESIGLIRKSNDEWVRHPLAFLVEAADDICYLMIDIEDAYKARLIEFNHAESLLASIAGPNLGRYQTLRDTGDRIQFLRSRAIGVLIAQTIDAFCERESALLKGELAGSILDHIPASEALQNIRNFSRQHIYGDARKVDLELSGFAVIRKLLAVLSDAILALENGGHSAPVPSFYVKSLLHRFSTNYSVGNSRYENLRRLVDYVSGMTDGFAAAQFRTVVGTRDELAR